MRAGRCASRSRQPTGRRSLPSIVVAVVAVAALATVALAVCSDPAFPVDCQTSCCPAGTLCGPGGATCINPHPCSDPAFPLECNGTICCPAGHTCNTVNPQLCCPAGYTVSCQSSCCPTGHHCGADGASCVRGDDTTDVLSAVSGLVRVNSVDASAGLALKPGDVIEVATGASATITLHDPPGTITLGSSTHPASVSLPLPETATDVAIRILRGLFSIGKDPRRHTRMEVEALNVTVSVEGTILTVESDPDAHEDAIAVTIGSIQVTPKNSALPPFTLNAGEQVVVGTAAVSAVTQVCTVAPCDDGDACTADGCSATACRHEPAGDFDAFCSACQGGIGSLACAGQSLPASIGKRLALACSLHDQAASKPAKAAQKLLRRAAKNVKSAAAAAKKAGARHNRPISADCAATIVTVLR